MLSFLLPKLSSSKSSFGTSMSYVFTDDVIMDHRDPIHEGTSTSTAFLGLGTSLLLSKLSMDEVVRWGKLHKVVFDDLRCGVVDLKRPSYSVING